MKIYSYVNERGDFKGPHTIDELFQLKGLKVIDDPTQVLDESSRRLTTLREILSTKSGPVVFPVAPASTAAPPMVVTPTPRNKGFCIACGGKIPATSAQCPYCQMDAQRTEITGRDFILALEIRLSKINAEIEDDTEKGKAILTAISTFNMPNDKENLLEFFSLCDGNVSASSGVMADNDWGALHGAWYGKAKMAYLKLKVYAHEDNSLLATLAPYGQKYENDAYLKAQQIKQAMFIGGIILAIVIMALVATLAVKLSK
jgi:hypothetical protein